MSTPVLVAVVIAAVWLLFFALAICAVMVGEGRTRRWMRASREQHYETIDRFMRRP